MRSTRMMSRASKLKILAFGLNLLVMLHPVSARDIHFEFTFSGRKAPSVGLVYISGAGEKLSLQNPVVDQKDKQFTRSLIITSPKDTITFLNSDSVNHNIYANDRDTGVNFDVGLKPPGVAAKIQVDWAEGKIVRLGCKIHPKMRTYVANVPTPHHSIFEMEPKDRKALVQIEDVPPEFQQATFWLPRYDKLEFVLPERGTLIKEVTRKGKVRGELKVTTLPTETHPDKIFEGYRSFQQISDMFFSKTHWNRHVRIFMNAGHEVFSHNYRAFLCLQGDDEACDEEEGEPEFRTYPPGTIIVKEHCLPTTNPKITNLLTIAVMVKGAPGSDPENGDWKYYWINKNGDIILQGDSKKKSVANTCANCHKEVADRDFIYSTIGNPMLFEHISGKK